MVLAVSVLTFDNSVGVPCVQICFAICVYVVFFSQFITVFRLCLPCFLFFLSFFLALVFLAFVPSMSIYVSVQNFFLFGFSAL